MTSDTTPHAASLPERLMAQPLSPAVAVGRAPTRDEVAALARAGFRALISNRPDGEKDSPMTSAETAAAASECGLAYAHIPVEGRVPLEKDVRAFAEALRSLPLPAYAYCHTGGRSAALWALVSVRESTTEALIETCARAGHDITGLAAKIDMRREMLEGAGE
jgi:sulfide:quinone oxidoreductase